MSKFIDPNYSSVVISRSGNEYRAERIVSQTHLFDIPSELAALVRAVHANDPVIVRVRTTMADAASPISPLVLKILADHSVRVGTVIQYEVRDANGKMLFETNDVCEELPFYRSPGDVLPLIVSRVPEIGKVSFDPDVSIESQLRKWAREGVKRNFPVRHVASGYGAAVLTKSGLLYFGGQYSTFDERLGVHAEMGVILNALFDGASDITHIGIASTKYLDSPCSPCGFCRQFIAEMSHAVGEAPSIHLFSFENEQSDSYSIDELLPVQWSDKK